MFQMRSAWGLTSLWEHNYNSQSTLKADKSFCSAAAAYSHSDKPQPPPPTPASPLPRSILHRPSCLHNKSSPLPASPLSLFPCLFVIPNHPYPCRQPTLVLTFMCGLYLFYLTPIWYTDQYNSDKYRWEIESGVLCFVFFWRLTVLSFVSVNKLMLMKTDQTSKCLLYGESCELQLLPFPRSDWAGREAAETSRGHGSGLSGSGHQRRGGSVWCQMIQTMCLCVAS